MEEKPKKISYKSLKEKLSDNALKRIIAGSGGSDDDLCGITCWIWFADSTYEEHCCSADYNYCINAFERNIINGLHAGSNICDWDCETT